MAKSSKERRLDLLSRDPDYFRRAGRAHYSQKKALILESQRKKREQKVFEMFGVRGFALSENEVTIVDDPDPLGGFRKGVKVDHLAECLYNGALTPNTIVEARGEFYKVTGISRQKLVRVE